MPKQSERTSEAIEKLVPHLRFREMSAKDMLEVLHIDRSTQSYNWLCGVITQISTRYPLYEPIPCVYKILTNEDLEKEEYRRKQRCLMT